MADYEDASSPPIGYPPQGTPSDPKDHPATNFKSGSVRMQGLTDMISTWKKVGDNMRASLGKEPL